MIRLNVFISLEEANRTQVLEAARELTQFSTLEDGCISYDIYESATRPNVLMFCETWKDDTALAIHQKTAHFIKNIAILSKLASTKVERFEF